MAEYDSFTRARMAYNRSKWLAALSGGAIIYLAGFLDTFQSFQLSQNLLELGLIGLAFTLFVSLGILIVSSAADRWDTDQTVSPMLLVWEWRFLVLSHLAFLVSILLIVSYIINNIGTGEPPTL